MQWEKNNHKESSPFFYEGDNDLMNIEVRLLLEAIYLRYGYDFRHYSKAHLKRRISHRLSISHIKTISQLQDKILWDRQFFFEFLEDLSINVTEMFRDPECFLEFRKSIIPVLSTYAFIKIWIAGCATGEEVYSLAILLEEENLLNRTQIYATDFNKNVLNAARQGIYSNQNMDLYSRNYKKAGGKKELSDYYTSKYGSVIFDKSLIKRIVFADHNLVTDSVFSEVHLISCRNVLIYFEKKLQNHVIGLFHKSLSNKGFLCLGTKESLRFTNYEDKFTTIDEKAKIYRKKPIYSKK